LYEYNQEDSRPTFPQGIYSGGMLEEGADYILYYGHGTGCDEPAYVEKMTLQGIYGGCTIFISGWSQHWAYNDPEYDNRCITSETAMSHFKLRFQQAKKLINVKCGF
jgi:ubiquinone biosynthesis protein COQ9